jgi:hypothetical protein
MTDLGAKQTFARRLSKLRSSRKADIYDSERRPTTQPAFEAVSHPIEN